MMILSFDVEASFSGSMSGSTSGSGSVNDDGSISNYIIFQQTNAYNGVNASNISGSTVTYVSLGTYYYNTYTNRSTPISSISQLYSGSVYYITDHTTGDSWYAFQTSSNGTRCFPMQISLASTSSNPSLSFSGSVSGTLSGTLNMEDDFEYPPAFPTSSGFSYNSRTQYYLQSVQFICTGENLAKNDSYYIYKVDCIIYFNTVVPYGNYSAHIFLNEGTVPYTEGSYLTASTGTSGNASLYGASIGFNSFDVQFNLSSGTNVIVPSFYIYSSTQLSAFNTGQISLPRVINLYTPDSSVTNDLLTDVNTSLSSAGGKNGGLNSQNSLMDSTLSEYQSETDTSEQYNKISSDLFTYDISIFTSVASTMTLFNACITSIFTKLGDLSVPLTMFLVFVFISAVIGIARVFGGGS